MTISGVTGLSTAPLVSADPRSRASSHASNAGVAGLSASIHVGGGPAAASLRTRSLSSVDLDADSVPAAVSATVDLSAARPSSEPLFLSNSFKGTTRVKAMSSRETLEMRSLYEAVKMSCIEKGIVQPDVSGFTVGIDQSVIKYLDGSGNRVQKSILADMEGDPALAEKVTQLRDFADEHMPYNLSTRPSLSSKSKGSLLGAAPLKRNTEVLKLYPTAVKENTRSALDLLAKKYTDSKDHLAALTKMGVAETFHEPLHAQISTLQTDAKTKLEQAQAAHKPQAEIEPLQKEVDALNSLAVRICEMDPYATSIALAFSPTEDRSSAAVTKRAEDARDVVEEKYNHDHQAYELAQYEHTKWESFGLLLNGLWYGNWEWHKPISYNEDYAKDVGGLLFASEPDAQASYHHYCAENGLLMKAESFDDVFFRTIIAFTQDTNFEVKEALAPYFEKLSTATKDAINSAITTATTKAKLVADKARTVPDAPFQAASIEDRISQFRAHVGLSALPAAPAGAPAPATLVGSAKAAAQKASNAVRGLFSRRRTPVPVTPVPVAPAAAASA